MRIRFLFITASLIIIFFKSQVGINTSNPGATLDVNGNVIIRLVNPLPAAGFQNKILTLDSNNEIYYVALSGILPSPAVVKGNGGSGFSVLSAALLSGWQKVSFPVIEIDEGNNYDLPAQEFVAPAQGIYHVYFFLEMPSLALVSTLGAGIFKIDATSGVATLLSEDSFLNISLLGTNVSSPTRKTETLVRLNSGDKIVFGMRVPTANIGLFSNSKAQFGIWSIK